MKIAVIGLNDSVEPIVAALKARFDACDCLRCDRDGELGLLVERGFAEYQGLVFVMAAGIVARVIAPRVRSKHEDPAVVVVDDAARWAISLLSGHEGGANRLAYAVAAVTGAWPVITTGSETSRRLIVGVGCRRGTKPPVIKQAVCAVLREAGFEPSDVRHAASIQSKRNDRQLIQAFDELDIPLLFLPEERVNSYTGPYSPSFPARRHLGVRAVAEPCALLAGRRTELVVRKRAFPRVTVAIAKEDMTPGPRAVFEETQWDR